MKRSRQGPRVHIVPTLVVPAQFNFVALLSIKIFLTHNLVVSIGNCGEEERKAFFFNSYPFDWKV